MIKWMIKKSEVEDIMKSMGKSKLDELKAQVIAILKKAEEKEVKKAIEYFESTEEKYTHLEKSVTGEWVEKAGYGIGTVRIWKGKKYKKVGQGKWLRVFDKEDRGAKSSMTRLINKVNSCKSEEELYQFCMSNHALFLDDNGVDLPIMDKLRSAIDKQSGLLEQGEKVNARMKEYQKEDLAKLKAGNYSFDSFNDFKAEIKKQGNDFRGSKQPNYIGYLSQYNDNYLQQVYDSLPGKETKPSTKIKEYGTGKFVVDVEQSDGSVVRNKYESKAAAMKNAKNSSEFGMKTKFYNSETNEIHFDSNDLSKKETSGLKNRKNQLNNMLSQESLTDSAKKKFNEELKNINDELKTRESKSEKPAEEGMNIKTGSDVFDKIDPATGMTWWERADTARTLASKRLKLDKKTEEIFLQCEHLSDEANKKYDYSGEYKQKQKDLLKENNLKISDYKKYRRVVEKYFLGLGNIKNDEGLRGFSLTEEELKTVKKSLFDDLLDFIDENKGDDDNDATSPELFNSTAQTVSEVMDDIFC